MDTCLAPARFRDQLQHFVHNHPDFNSLLPWLHRLDFRFQDSKNVSVHITDSSLSSLFSVELRSLLSSSIESLFDHSLNVDFVFSKIPSISSNLSLTFEKFFSGSGNRLAVAAARSIAENPCSSYNPLFVYSGVGTGKTHLLHAIANHYLALHSNTSFRFLSAEILISLLSNSTYSNVSDELLLSDFLILDDVHRLSDHPSAQHSLSRIFDHLHNNQKQMVFSSNSSPKFFSSFSESLRSRFQWGLVIEIEALSPESLSDLILQKCGELELELPDSALLYLTRNCSSNIREIEGILNRIRSHVRLLSEPVDLPLVRSIVSDYTRTSVQRVSLTDIRRAVCDYFGVSQNDLLSKSRARSVAYPRQVGMYLAKTMTSSSLEEIGRCFGGRDHSTVKHGCEKIRTLCDRDISVRAIFEECRKRVLISC